MQLIDLVNDVKELMNTEDSGNVSTLQASMLSVLTDEAIVHSQKKVSSYCVPFASEPLIQQVDHAASNMSKYDCNTGHSMTQFEYAVH